MKPALLNLRRSSARFPSQALLAFASVKLIAQLCMVMLPFGVKWAQAQETRIFAEGIPLTESLLADARTLGVAHSERIRLLKVDVVPMPLNSLLLAVAKISGLHSPTTAGMALRYGIYIQQDYWGSCHIIAHECVHTTQYERLGGFRPFLKLYIQECIEQGYPQSPLEREAILRSAELVR